MDEKITDEVLLWARELQFLAQCGLAYSKDVYDIERFMRIRDISAKMLSYKTDVPFEKVKDIFCNETGFQTPKLDTRAAVFKDDKILLVKEKDGFWSLPGGWVDEMESLKSNTIKEVYEEAGLIVEVEKLIALHDRNKRNSPPYIQNICKAFFLCKFISGEFKENTETVESGYFSLDNLPKISNSKNTKEQIKMCFDCKNAENWNVIFD